MQADPNDGTADSRAPLLALLALATSGCGYNRS